MISVPVGLHAAGRLKPSSAIVGPIATPTPFQAADRYLGKCVDFACRRFKN
jgi:hypothetical protein